MRVVGFTLRPAPGRATYPRSLRGVSSCARRCLRRDVDGRIRPSHVAAAGAWKESPDGSRSRRPAATVAAEAPAMAPVCSDRPEGSRCERRCSGNRTRREAKASQQDTNRRHAGAARQPRDPSRVPGSPTGFPGRRTTEPPGPGGTGPRVADEAPAYPSHPRPHAGDGRRVGELPARFTRRRWKGASKDGCRRRPRRFRARQSGW